jgi:histone deacetylase 6
MYVSMPLLLIISSERERETTTTLTHMQLLQNSLVFVSESHGIWKDQDRKPSKRYGKLFKSNKSSLSEMMTENQQQVFEWLADRADEALDETEDEAEEDLTMKG